jgi:putative oxidoreductase
VGTLESFRSQWTPRLHSVLRIVAALLFLQHGTQKLFVVPSSQSATPVALSSLLGVAGVLEVVGGLLLLVGLWTRPVAFVLSGHMAVAYFFRHAPQGFWPLLNRGEVAVLYCFMFLYFAAAGGGPWSLDARGGPAARKREGGRG